ncbi:SDR family NAD(P)-dependent oxidoreductase [Verrucomicrobia bacterium]|nr:SDR family NAD(P)-dependent oxidoreductase [Verrucomicrobiota bacterium]
MSEHKKTVLITGAAGGLGRALVKTFDGAGWHVIAACRKADGTFPDSVREIEMDVTEDDSVRAGIDDQWKALGGIDCIINNAAIIRDQLSMKMTISDWDSVMDVCLKGVWRVSRSGLRLMMKQRRGLIVNVSSFSALVGHVGQANYAAAKAGLIGLTQSMAREGGPRNVRANVVIPGLMETRMLGDLTGERKAELLGQNVIKIMSDPKQVAHFIEGLTGLDQVSGQVFNLDSRIIPWT